MKVTVEDRQVQHSYWRRRPLAAIHWWQAYPLSPDIRCPHLHHQLYTCTPRHLGTSSSPHSGSPPCTPPQGWTQCNDLIHTHNNATLGNPVMKRYSQKKFFQIIIPISTHLWLTETIWEWWTPVGWGWGCLPWSHSSRLVSVCDQLELPHQAGVNVAMLGVGAVTLQTNKHCHSEPNSRHHQITTDPWARHLGFWHKILLEHWDGIDY